MALPLWRAVLGNKLAYRLGACVCHSTSKRKHFALWRTESLVRGRSLLVWAVNGVAGIAA